MKYTAKNIIDIYENKGEFLIIFIELESGHWLDLGNGFIPSGSKDHITKISKNKQIIIKKEEYDKEDLDAILVMLKLSNVIHENFDLK